MEQHQKITDKNLVFQHEAFSEYHRLFEKFLNCQLVQQSKSRIKMILKAHPNFQQEYSQPLKKEKIRFNIKYVFSLYYFKIIKKINKNLQKKVNA